MHKIIVIVLFIFLVSCASERDNVFDESLLVLPQGFPMPLFPDDNQLTAERWELGKKLFFDTRLSKDNTISCASCHLPELAFTDGRKVSEGIEHRPGKRNAPSLANIAYHPYLTREGGVPTLEMQILVPVQEHAEFDFNMVQIAERLVRDADYTQASIDAYGRTLDAFVITRAIGCFERTLISGNSRYDQFVNGNSSILSAAEKRGKDLFFSDRLACSSCHGGFNFSSYAFDNNGLYLNYEDPGRFRLTGIDSDLALFKIPSLRNVEITAPYMHDGSIELLEDVIVHYNKGGEDHVHKSALIKPLNMSAGEQHDLVAFLKTLTDHEFITNPKFKN